MEKDKTEILLSVIVPVYNTDGHLRECLDSLASQTQKNIEYLLINDGSTDDSGKILSEYAQKHDFFRLIEQENKGYAGARNTGLECARGKYIGFVDSDDKIKPDMFEKLLKTALEEKADIASCSFSRLYDSLNIVVPQSNKSRIELLSRSGGKLEGSEELLLDDATIWKNIYLNSMLKENNIKFDEKMIFGEDVYFNWCALCSAKKIIAIPDNLYYYRMLRKGSQTQSSDARIFAYFITCSELGNYVKKPGLSRLIPWYNHLCLSFICFGYARLDKELRQEYFEKFRQFLIENDIKNASQIAFAKAPRGVLQRLRYLILRYLHPVTLHAVLRKNRKLFDFIIDFREFLGRLPLSSLCVIKRFEF